MEADDSDAKIYVLRSNFLWKNTVFKGEIQKCLHFSEIVPVNEDYNIMIKTFKSNGNLIAFRNCSFDLQGVIFFANKPTQIEMSSSSFKLERLIMIISLSNI